MQQYVEFKHSGFLITVDGIDGSGKSTLTKRLKDWLEEHDYKVFTTEWNSSSWMEPAIDDAKERRVLIPLTLTLASATDLADRIERDIKPELEKGHVVICDRYLASAIARGIVRGLNEDWIKDLHATFIIKPNLGFYLHVSPKEARDRLLADKGRVGHHESGSDVLGKEKGESKDEDETNKRNFVRFMEKQIPIFNRLAKEFHLYTIDTLDKKKRKVRHEAEDILKEALDKHPSVLKKDLAIENVPAGKLRIPGAQRKVLVYNDDTVTQEGDTPSPRFVPENEQVWYDKIHGLQGKTLHQLRQSWTKFKKDFLSTIEKDLEIEKADPITPDQADMFKDMLGEFDNIAQAAFMNAVGLGNLYFEDQFQVNGINQKQQEQVADKHFNTFQNKAQNLFQDDVISNLRENTFDKWFNVLNGFDKYLAGYANAVAAVAYDTFTKDIGLLNKGIGKAYQLAGRGKRDNIVKVIWVLDPEAHHSDDCWNMAELDKFGYGPGVWDADYLAQNDLVPRSPQLDCGGNCKCHVSAYVPLDAEDTSWLDNMLKTPMQESVLELIPNMTKPEFMKTMGRLNIPEQIGKILSEQGFLRRLELWKKLPAIEVSVFSRATFGVAGETIMNFDTKLPQSILLELGLPEGTTLDTLTEVQKKQLVKTVSHELGHLITNDAIGSGVPVGIFGDKVADTLYTAAYQERLQALGQVQVNFERAVSQIAESSLTEQIRHDIGIMQLFNENPDEFLDTLFTAVMDGKDFQGVPAKQAWTLVNNVLAQYSPGVAITSTYQLWNTDEYFAEWFAMLLTDPDKAALFSPRLSKLASALLPDGFFDNAIRRRVANLLPEAIAATRRIDLPLPSKFDPIAPNVTDFNKAVLGINSITKKIGTDTVAEDILNLIKNNPQIQRTEFFDDLKINFADKVQIGKRVGSQRAFGFYDTDTETFFVNYDKWKDLDSVQKSNYLGDIVAQQILQTAAPKVEKAIADRFTIYLDSALRFLEKKGVLEGLRPDELKSIRETIIGVPPIQDEATGEMSTGVPRNLGFWMRNFESMFKPVLQNITDFPVLNIDSLASPSAFFREWVRLYLTSPEVASVYPGFREILQQYLGMQKSLEFEKAGILNRVIQWFGGKAGFWVTHAGKRIFIDAAETGVKVDKGVSVASAKRISGAFSNLPSAVQGYIKELHIADVAAGEAVNMEGKLLSAHLTLGEFEPETSIMHIYAGAIDKAKVDFRPTLNHEAGHAIWSQAIKVTDSESLVAKAVKSFTDSADVEGGVSRYAESFRIGDIAGSNKGTIFHHENFAELHMIYRAAKLPGNDVAQSIWDLNAQGSPRTISAFLDILRELGVQ